MRRKWSWLHAKKFSLSSSEGDIEFSNCLHTFVSHLSEVHASPKGNTKNAPAQLESTH